jgi:hypothetical protein
VQWVQVEVAVPVSLKMYWGIHESSLADSGRFPQPYGISSFIRLLFSMKLQ